MGVCWAVMGVSVGMDTFYAVRSLPVIDKTYVFTYRFATGDKNMTTITASQARADLYRLIDQTAESHKPVLISGKRANAVLVSEEDWSAIQETLYLLAIPGMRESIKEAMAEPLAKSKRTLKW